MKLILSTVMGWVIVCMVLSVPMRAIDTIFALTWVGMYVVMCMLMVCVWEGTTRAYRYHGTPMPKGRTHLRLVTPDYSVYVAGSEGTPTTYRDYDPGLEYDLDHEEDQ